MKKNKNLGAACGRIHPVGSGPMVWYQLFEYAIGHWLQKATEHMIGCVMCSPGCFSLFRAKALMDDNVMRRYTTKSEEPMHYVQYDQVGICLHYLFTFFVYIFCLHFCLHFLFTFFCLLFQLSDELRESVVDNGGHAQQIAVILDALCRSYQDNNANPNAVTVSENV